MAGEAGKRDFLPQRIIFFTTKSTMSAQSSQREGIGVRAPSVCFAGPSVCFVVENYLSCLDLFFTTKSTMSAQSSQREGIGV